MDTRKKVKSPNKYDEQVGKNIKYHRLLRGKTIKDIAGKLSVSWQQYNKYESGGNRITIGRLFDISDALGVPIVDLLKEVRSCDVVRSNAQISICRRIMEVEDKEKLKAIKTLLDSWR